MIDPFARFADTPTAPASRCFAVSPADEGELPHASKAIYVGKGGDVTLRALDDDSDVTFVGVPSGGILDVRVRAVRATGTTAADLVALV